MSAAKCTGGTDRCNSRDQTWSRTPAQTLGRPLSTQYSVLSTQYSRRAICYLLFCFTAWPFFAGRYTSAADSIGFSDRLSSLAAKCDDLGLKEQAQTTRSWIIPRHAGRQYLFLPAIVDSTAPKAGAPENVSFWHKRFLELRRDQAAAQFAEAKAASDSRQADRAYQLLHEVLREDPDHAEARRILGYVKTGSEWKLPDSDKAVPRQPPANEPRTGWRARGYWSLETPHFRIVSNDQRELKEAGQQLEDLHTLWRQIFFRYWSNSDALAARFAGGDEPLAPPRPKMQVVLFKTRPEYEAHMVQTRPKAAKTLGLYDDKQRVSYFFGGDKSVYPTWYHEATHQLFQESIAGTRDEPGQERNFWALEGVALYMESLAQHAGYWTAGGWEADRMQFTRNRVFSGEFSVPLSRLSGLTREQIQSSDDIRKLYAEAAGFAHFLLDGEAGTYREAFIDLLATIYRGEDTANALAKNTAKSLEALDQQYRAFLNVTDENLAQLPDPSKLRSLLLGRTSVTDKGLARLAACTNLERLDLSLTATTDVGFKHLESARKLSQLYLAGTKITDASMPLIGSFKELEDLDLGSLPLSDDALANLAGLKKLKELRLAGSPITDAGLVHLRGLKQLVQLDLTGTQITPEGLKRLQTTLPKLKLSMP